MNKRIWNQICRKCGAKFDKIFVGKQGRTIVIALGDIYASGGYFHFYPTLENDTMFDGNVDFDDDEEYFNFITSFLTIFSMLISSVKCN